MPKKIEIDEEKMLELYDSGLSNSAIGRYFGIGHNGISRRLEKYGLVSHNIPSEINIVDDKIECTNCGNFLDRDSYELRDDGRAWRRECKKCHNKKTVLRRHSNDERRIRARLAKYREIANKKNILFDIDYEYLVSLLNSQKGLCFYSDETLVFPNIGTKRNGRSPTIDKIIPELGYTKGNVVWCIDRCNRIKSDATLDEMKKWMPDWYERINQYASHNTL